MNIDIPIYVSVVFLLTSLLTVILYHFAFLNSASTSPKGNAIIITSMVSFWLVIQAILTLNDFYVADTTGVPPRFALAMVPPFLVMLVVFLTKRGKIFVDTLPMMDLTYLNTLRIPIELVLFWLSLHKAVPQLMTFAGKNFDIIAGISAPFIAYWGFEKSKLINKSLLAWNIFALLLLLNVLTIGILSAPFDFEQFSFRQPNIAVLHFPFIWLPSYLVPIFIFGHLVCIRQLLMSMRQVLPDQHA